MPKWPSESSTFWIAPRRDCRSGFTQLDNGSGLAVVQQLLDGINGTIDATRPARCLAVMYEIANPDSLLKRPSDSGGTGVRPGTPGSVKDELFAEPVIVFRPIEHHPHHESLSSAWSSLQA